MPYAVQLTLYLDVDDAHAVWGAARREVIGPDRPLEAPDDVADSFGEHLPPALAALMGSPSVFDALDQVVQRIPGLSLHGTHAVPEDVMQVDVRRPHKPD